MISFIKIYFAQTFTPLIRYLHYLVIIFVLYQLLISNFIEVSDGGVIGSSVGEYYGTWSHIIIGLALLALAFVFIVIELSKHGCAYFYPYVFGDIDQLKADIHQLKSLTFPKLQPKGLAAIIQGLGLGALFLVVMSGAAWFLFWWFGSPLANDIKELHELFTGLIEAYIIGHGAIGMLHIFLTYRERKLSNKPH